MIRKAARTQALPMGFGTNASHRSTPTMLLLARVGSDHLNKAASLLGHGADLLIVETTDLSRLKGRLKEVGESPVGMHMAAVDGAAAAKLREVGADFAVFDAGVSEADVLLEEQLGFVLAISQEISDVALRVLESLPLDALVVPPLDGPLTLQRHLELKRLSILSRTPLLVDVEPRISAAHLRVLRDAGVGGVIVDGADAGGDLSDLRQVIDGLPPRGRRREERMEARLPAAIPAAAEEAEEEE